VSPPEKVYGIHSVRALLQRAPARVHRLWLARARQDERVQSIEALAEQAGIAVGRGVLVNDRMETSAPGVFAAGDVAEHDGRVLGLWPIAAKQGEVAALNALGGDARLTAEIPASEDRTITGAGRIRPAIVTLHRRQPG